MFDLVTLSARDAAMLAIGAVAVASGIAAIGIVHKVAPAVGAWMAKERVSWLALEDKMRGAFGLASTAIANVDAAAKAGDAEVKSYVDSYALSLSSDTRAATARIAALETAVFGKPAAPATILAAPAPKPAPVA
jgi:hypothetical protein